MKTNKRLILLDVHAILHRAYHALPDFSSSKGEPTGALYGLCTMIMKIVAELKPDYIAACYDLPKPTYRHEAYANYKAGRQKTDGDLVSQIVRSRDIFTAFNIPIYEKEGFEADDLLGTIAERVKKGQGVPEGMDVVIASGDMDTLQLVSGERVRVYTLKKGIKDTIIYNEESVKERFGFGPELLPDYKGLRGDPSDNIIGIKGIGEKTASVLIQNFGTIEEMYAALKKNKEKFTKLKITPRIIGLLEEGEEEAKFSKMLGTIHRDVPVDFALPEQTWKEGLSTAAIVKLFSNLEFRSLGARVKEVFSLQGDMNFGAISGEGGAMSADDMGSPIVEEPATDITTIDPQQLRETTIALWVIDSNLTNPGLEEIFEYTHTKNFAKAREIILKEVEKRSSAKVFREIELPLMPVVDRMEKRGIRVDRERLTALSVEYHAELEKIQSKIWAEAGKEFNINSPKQLGEMLFDHMQLTAKGLKKTEGGARSTRESELEKMREIHPIIGHILEYRELQKLLSTYIDVIPTLLDKTNRLHANFIQAGSTTGRMSSQNPNLQNIPIKTDLGRRIRTIFIAEPGFSLVAFDYSQIQLRVAAFLSGDKKLIEIFRSGGDIHTAVASEVFGVAPEKVDYEMRRRAKVINFGIIYGMGVNALRQNLGTDRKEAQLFYDNYFAKFSGLAAYLDRVKAEAARNGYTETYYGRRRYFEGIKSKIPYIRASAERMAINAPIQGTEADIIKLAMAEINRYIDREGYEYDAYLLLQVHDELVYEIEEKKAEKIAKRIKDIMENILPPEKVSGVRCVAEYSIGENWGDMK